MAPGVTTQLISAEPQRIGAKHKTVPSRRPLVDLYLFCEFRNVFSVHHQSRDTSVCLSISPPFRRGMHKNDDDDNVVDPGQYIIKTISSGKVTFHSTTFYPIYLIITMVNPLLVPLALFAATATTRTGRRFVGCRMLTTRLQAGVGGVPSSSSSSTSSSITLSPLLSPSTGSELSLEEIQQQLKHKRVALYFSAGWCPMCTSLEPALIQFREAAAQSGKPIELVYVSSDRSATDQMKRAAKLNMLSIPFDQTGEYKKKFQVWAGSESLQFGIMGRRRSGVPALVVLDKDGTEMAFVAAESQGVKALGTWPMDNEKGIW
jgi:thiol-disulfide isomerase/thioredoxin